MPYRRPHSAHPAPGLLFRKWVSRGEPMRVKQRVVWSAAGVCSLVASAACGSLGNVLGGVLGSPQSQSNQVSGYVEAVNTRTQQLAIQTANGERVVLSY